MKIQVANDLSKAEKGEPVEVHQSRVSKVVDTESAEEETCGSLCLSFCQQTGKLAGLALAVSILAFSMGLGAYYLVTTSIFAAVFYTSQE